MARKAKELSALEVSRLKVVGLHAVGGVAGLCLQVKETGARSWICRITVGTKRREIGLGGFPDVTLATAREKAREARETVEQGTDPVLRRKQLNSALKAEQSKSISFADAARLYIEAKSSEWKNVKHLGQWNATLEAYAFPLLGKLLVSDIQQAHVMSVLEPIWSDRTETASRLRSRIELILNWATTRGFREGVNPARWRGHLDQLLPKPTKIAKTKHHRALDIDAMYGFMERLKPIEGVSAKALEFLIYTAARSGEVRGAMWREIDLQSGVWIIPGSRMKAGKEHRVPLPTQAIELLASLPRMADSEFIFAAPRGGQLSDMSMLSIMRRMKVDAVPHGFRSTFRDWSGERTAFPRDLCEMALAHALENKVEAAYRRGDMLRKRAKMMQAWADFVCTPPIGADVIQFKSA